MGLREANQSCRRPSRPCGPEKRSSLLKERSPSPPSWRHPTPCTVLSVRHDRSGSERKVATRRLCGEEGSRRVERQEGRESRPAGGGGQQDPGSSDRDRDWSAEGARHTSAGKPPQPPGRPWATSVAPSTRSAGRTGPGSAECSPRHQGRTDPAGPAGRPVAPPSWWGEMTNGTSVAPRSLGPVRPGRSSEAPRASPGTELARRPWSREGANVLPGAGVVDKICLAATKGQTRGDAGAQSHGAREGEPAGLPKAGTRTTGRLGPVFRWSSSLLGRWQGEVA